MPEPPAIVQGSAPLAGRLHDIGAFAERPTATLIVGVAGLVGSALAKRLLLAKEAVVGIDSMTGVDSRLRWDRVENLFGADDTSVVLQGHACNASLIKELHPRFDIKLVVILDERCSCTDLGAALAHLRTDKPPIVLHSLRDSDCGGLRSVFLDIPGVYGPGQWPYDETAEPLQLAPISSTDLYVDDVVCGLVKILQHRAAHQQGTVARFTANASTAAGATDLCSITRTGAAELTVHAHTPAVEGSARARQWMAAFEARLMPCESGCQASPPSCFPSAWSAAAAESRRRTEGCSVVAYTVLIGGATDIHPLPSYWTHAPACHVAFVSAAAPLLRDTERLTHARWNFVSVPELREFADARKASRLPKLSPEGFFASSVQHALYVDSKLQLNIAPDAVLRLFRDGDSPRERSVLMLVRHAHTRDLAHDAALVLANHRSNITHYPSLLRRQVLDYEAQGGCYADTFDGAFILHDLRSQAARRLRCRWLRQFLLWSDRDQISGAYAIAASAARRPGPCVKGGTRVPLRGGEPSAPNVTAVLKMLPADKYYWRGSEALAKWERLD